MDALKYLQFANRGILKVLGTSLDLKNPSNINFNLYLIITTSYIN